MKHRTADAEQRPSCLRHPDLEGLLAIFALVRHGDLAGDDANDSLGEAQPALASAN
jgi:hypothetical protein